MFQYVMITLDGSELSELALNYVGHFAGPDSHVTLLSVVNPPPDPILYAMYDEVPNTEGEYMLSGIEEAVTAAKDYLAAVSKRLEGRGYHLAQVVKVGDPVVTIVGQAFQQQVDVIVMASHGRTGLQRMLFGSVARGVVNALPCPVFVIPGREYAKTNDTVKLTSEHDT